jgi:hypothetical protein
MKRTHLGIQAIIVLAMVWCVSWPEFRPVRAQTIWRYSPEAALEARTADAARYTNPGVVSSRREPPSQPLPSPTPQSPLVDDEHLGFTPGAIAVLGGRNNALVGLAQNSLNAVIPRARVVLRDIRTGDALQQTTADDLGQFSFIDLTPSDYIVELLGPDGSVVGTSEVVTTSKGGLLRTVVRVAAAATAIVAALSMELSPTLPQVNTLATTSDVTRTTTTQTPRVTSTGN